MTPNSAFGWFEDDPVLELLPDGRSVRLVESLRFVRSGRHAFDTIEVPAGFVCDGASIPRILWPLSGGPFEGKHRDGAIVHDYLYSRIRELWPERNDTRWRDGVRADADHVFYEAMRACGVSEIHARAKYAAVRLFGGKAAA